MMSTAKRNVGAMFRTPIVLQNDKVNNNGSSNKNNNNITTLMVVSMYRYGDKCVCV